MGSSHIKDKNITIFMLTNKEFYKPGEYVEGEIYIRVAQPTQQYNKLIINLHGREKLYWRQGTDGNQRSYSNRYDSYDSSFVVMDFRGQLYKNDYIFPFQFLLPSQMTGSFLYCQAFLKYILKAELMHSTEPKKNQFYEISLNIIEPPRIKPGPTTMTLQRNSKCCEYDECFKFCCCCTDYGIVSVSLSCDKNIITNGDTIKVNGVVDNTRGTQIITHSRVVLQRRICLISSQGYMTNYRTYQLQFYQIGPIQPSNRQEFIFTATIPETLDKCTAIGNIMSMYYVLHLYTKYGCCTNSAEAQLHLFFNSKVPKIVSPQIVSKPQNWNPQKMEKVICQNMNPYVYKPHPKLFFTNLPTNQIKSIQHMDDRNNIYDYTPIFQNEQMKNNSQTQRQMIYKFDSKEIIGKL